MKPTSGYAALKKSDSDDPAKRDTVIVSMRVAPEVQAALTEMAAAAGVSPRTFFEKHIMRFAETHVVKKRETPDLRALLFQVSRAGNNLNQIAHKFNSLDMAGRLSQGRLDDGIEQLAEIKRLLAEALSRAR